MSNIIKKLDYIDSLRGVAVLLVLLVHTLTFLDRGNLNSLFRVVVEQGRMGVQLFYIASAFTLFYSLSQRDLSEKFSKINFYIRRFFRIAPMFYIAIIYYFWQYITFYSPNIEAADTSTFTIANIVSHFTFTFGVSPYWINTIVPGGWSVGVEMIFYLCIPALYFLYKKYGAKFLYLALPVTVSISWIFNYIIFIILDENLSRYWHAFLYYNFFAHLPIFILGLVVYDHISNEKKSLKNINLIFISSIILFVSSLYLNRITSEGIFAGSLLMLSVLLAYFVIFISIYKPKILVNKIMVYIGKISYSMYLTHFISISIIIYFTKNNFYNGGEITFFFSYLLLVAMTILISSVTYKYIEKPGIIIGNKLIEKLKS
jgi:peptidoglycan/LPS O-acetylase OafA/YrhL